MEITWNTMLIQKEDGSLWFKSGNDEQPAGATDICKHYRNMQYSLDTTIGNMATDMSHMLDPVFVDQCMWEIEFQEMPDNCNRIS